MSDYEERNDSIQKVLEECRSRVSMARGTPLSMDRSTTARMLYKSSADDVYNLFYKVGEMYSRDDNEEGYIEFIKMIGVCLDHIRFDWDVTTGKIEYEELVNDG